LTPRRNPPGVLLPKSNGSLSGDGLTPLAACLSEAKARVGWRSLFTDFLTRSKAAVSIVKVNFSPFADCTNAVTRPRSCSVLMHRTKFSADAVLCALTDADDNFLPLAAGDFLRLETATRRDVLRAMGFSFFTAEPAA
jgi:hypothetical protein